MTLITVSWLLCLLSLAKGTTINVYPTSSSCKYATKESTNSSLQNVLANMSSNCVLMLKPGCHLIDKCAPVLDKTNVSIVGDGVSESEVNITCTNGTGLVFLNVSRLSVQMLTILKCGLTGVSLNDTLNTIKDNMYVAEFNNVFKYPLSIHVGLLVVHSADVLLKRVRVQNMTGFGLLAINVIDSFTIESSKFAYNYNRTCFTLSSDSATTGGGAVIIFHDIADELSQSPAGSKVSITNTSFLYNSNCALGTQIVFYYTDLEGVSLSNKPYLIGGGGGLTVYFVNQNYRASLEMNKCFFQNNTAFYGGGMFLGMFVGTNSTITIEDSVFKENGFASSFDLYQRLIGQGLSMLKDIVFPVDPIPIAVGSTSIDIVNSSFIRNTADFGGAMALLSRYVTIGTDTLSDKIFISKCSFSQNSAYSSSTLHLFESKFSGVQPGIEIYFKDNTFFKNSVLQSPHFMLSGKSVDALNTVEGSAVRIILKGTNRFIMNMGGTPLYLESSVLIVDGEVCFTNNTGDAGGGMGISNSYVFLQQNSYVSFDQNQAYLQGGAIFYVVTNSLTSYDCFLFFDSFERECEDSGSCRDPSLMNITVSFTNNIAPTANVAYGTTLKSCPWVDYLIKQHGLNESLNPFRVLEEIKVFKFEPRLDNDSLSTPPARLTATVVGNDSEPLMPGQEVTVQVFSYDGFDQTVPDPISSVVLDNVTFGEQDSRLGNSSYWFVTRNKFFNVPVSVRSKTAVNGEKTVEIGIFSITSTAGSTFNVTIGDCYQGFEFPNDSSSMYKTCICSKGLQQFPSIKCFEENATIVVPIGHWLGQLSNGKWTLHACLFDYCQLGEAMIKNGNFDIQCNTDYGRTGILCGGCKEGMSAMFGTNECGHCTDLSLLLLIYFLVAGFLVVGKVGRLGITVSYGYINLLLFFVNIVAPFLTAMVFEENIYIFTPIVWYNLDLGFSACFYNGMTAIHRAYLNFVFPVYLYILLLLYTYLIRTCKYDYARWGVNASQVFATIILMTYTTLLQTCISGLSFVRLENDNSARWAIDPTVKYFGHEHAALGVISIAVLMFYLIPSTFMLLFPSLTLRTGLGRRFIPIYDAFWAPFRENRRFWVGFRLLLRIVPLVFVGFIPHPLNVLLLGIFTVVYTFIHICLKPFTGEVQNILDIYLNLSVLLLVIGALYTFFEIENTTDLNNARTHQTIYLILVMFLVYLAFVFVYIRHMYIKYKCLQNITEMLKKRIQQTVTFLKMKVFPRSRYKSNNGVVDDESKSTEFLGIHEQITAMNEYKHPMTNFTQLREPLLEDPNNDALYGGIQ